MPSCDGPRSSPKKRKVDETIAVPTADEVSWTVCCMDGATFSVALPDHTQVAEAKRAIGVLREVSRFAIELFVRGKEEPLDDEKRLSSADKVPLFMLPKAASDRLALEALFKSCGGADWTTKDGWMTGAGLGEWHGVTVDAEGRVVELDLQSANLAGPLPSEIQQLSALTKLNLTDNKLTGTIPAELGQLGALTVLYLAGNKLTGPIPAELGQLGALTALYMFSNQLSGAIPAWPEQLCSLEGLNLDDNQLSGAIPVELAQLPALVYLSLYGNQLSGQGEFRSHMDKHNPECLLALVPEDDSDEEESEEEDEEDSEDEEESEDAYEEQGYE